MSAASVGPDPWADEVVRFLHPEKSSVLERLHIGAADIEPLIARDLGLTVDEVVRRRHELHELAEVSAAELLARPGVLECVHDLPFEPGDVILALGDSVTDDAISWAHLLDATLRMSMPERDLTVINCGKSGDTTAGAIARLDAVVQMRPDWVLILLGTNDARRHGPNEYPVFTPTQTLANLAAIRQMISLETSARIVQLTPPPVVPVRIAEWDSFAAQRITWSEEDIRLVANGLLDADATVIDLHGSMTTLRDTLIGPDGLHPGSAGQQWIAESVIRSLSHVETERTIGSGSSGTAGSEVSSA